MKSFPIFLILLSLTSIPILAYQLPIFGETTEIQQQSAAGQQHQVAGLTFSTPVEFSAPTEIGLDASELVYSPSETETLRILIVRFSPESQQNIQQEISLIDYVKVVFLGLPQTRGEPKEREFFEQTITGEIIVTDFPTPRQLEIYLIELATNDKITLIFESSNISLDLKENLINSLSQSLTEIRDSDGK
jgi:hypothetical protein